MNPRSRRNSRIAFAAGFAGLLLLTPGCRRTEPGTYASPEEAVQALAGLVGTRDEALTEEIFGKGSVEIFRSGDEEQDRKAAARVKQLMAEKVAFEEIDEKTKVALFGEKAWPFPIPLVRTGERWRFDTAAGREELLNRRIGYNELATLASLHAFVDAQFEYFAQGRDGLRPAFAQKFKSSEGRHDGLYWPVAEGEDPSPIGDLVAGAAAIEATERLPFNGYYFRILTGQGPNAAGGERSYLDAQGLMTTGFAAIAWPAKHGNSGVMTFVINHRDMVFQKDLGAETETAVAAIQSFDPDATWEPTGDSLDHVEDDSEEAPAE